VGGTWRKLLGSPGARAWLVVALWAGLVWALGGDGFSASHTSRFLRPLLEWLFDDWTRRELNTALFWIRKAAHAVEYGLLTALITRASLIGAPRRVLRAVTLSLVCAIALAAADELRQGRSSRRTGTVRDVALDSAGAIGGVALLLTGRALWQRTRATRGTHEAMDAGGTPGG